jgi:Tol biopolymer transport system component
MQPINRFALIAAVVATPTLTSFVGQSASSTTDIAFASRRDGNWEIYSSSADGRTQRRLTDRPVQERFPLWSPDRTRLAFLAEPNEAKELWVMSSVGESPRRLATGVIGKASRQWFPDSRHIAVTAIVAKDTVVAIVDASGTAAMRRLTTGRGEHRDPTLSPDGKRIAFSSSRDGNREIYVMNTDGTDQRRLTNHPGSDGSPAWSPDGSSIAFVSDRDASKDVYLIRPDGGGLRRLTRGAQATRDLPRWSPDGKHLAIQLARGANYDIAVLTLATGRLTDVAASPEYDGSFDWAPDGESLAFISGQQNAEALFVVGAGGGATRRITTTPALTPSWTR